MSKSPKHVAVTADLSARDAALAEGGEDFGALLAEYGTPQALKLKVGDKVSGRVFHVTQDSVFCELSPSQEASIPRSELLDKEGELSVKVGDTVEAYVVSLASGIELRRRIGRDAVDVLMLEGARESRMPVTGIVTGVNKGGLEVAVGGARGFCPTSQIDVDFVQELGDFVGKTLEFQVRDVRDNGRTVVLSRRALLEVARQELAAETLKGLSVGSRAKATVTRLTSFGAFVDLGGVDALIPISELSHVAVSRVEDVVKTGDQLEVEILRIEDDPKRPGRSRIAVSRKATEPDPYALHADDMREGATLEGKVARLEKYGAFVELFPGVQGLVHISELSEKRVRHPSDVIAVGQPVTVRVLGVDPTARRVSLSIKETQRSTTPSGEAPKVGDTVLGIVERVERFGAFVSIGAGARALVPTAETGTPPNTDLSRALPIGTELPLRIIAIDEQGRIKASKKAHDAAEERALVDTYNQAQGGSRGFGTLGDLLKVKTKR